MSKSGPEVEHHEYVAVTRSLTKTVESGLLGDRVIAEHLPRTLGAAADILAEHPVDQLGRCVACRSRHRWPRRRTRCVGHDTVTYFFTGRGLLTGVRTTGRRAS